MGGVGVTTILPGFGEEQPAAMKRRISASVFMGDWKVSVDLEEHQGSLAEFAVPISPLGSNRWLRQMHRQHCRQCARQPGRLFAARRVGTPFPKEYGHKSGTAGQMRNSKPNRSYTKSSSDASRSGSDLAHLVGTNSENRLFHARLAAPNVRLKIGNQNPLCQRVRVNIVRHNHSERSASEPNRPCTTGANISH